MKHLKTILILGLFALTLFSLSLNAQVPKSEDFLTAAVNVGTSSTVTTSSSSIWVSEPGYSGVVALICTFTRSAGSTSTLDFYFQVSHDGGTTWENYDDITIEIPTNQTVYSGTTVRDVYLVYVHGITHMRLWKIVNNDGTNAVTACNVTLSQGVS